MITYGSTTLTSYNSIVNTEVYYYKSTSPTALSGGSWSTTKPTWESGKYVWQKIRTIYEDETYTESDPVNITGQQGATGDAAYSYKLNASDTAVTVSKTGEYSVNKITFTATYKQGTGAVTAYAGRFKIETTLNGTTWTTAYTSSGNESSKQYTLPENIISIRCSLYQAGGTSVLLDITTIPIVKDGIDAIGLRDSIPYYLASDKQTGVTRLDQGWTRFKPELTTEKRYLWVYYVSRYSEGDTQPELIEIKNDVINFENHGDESPVEDCIVDINPIQDLHGYDSPWVGGAGINKLNLANVGTGNFSQCTLINTENSSVQANIQNSYYSYIKFNSGTLYNELVTRALNGQEITFEVDDNYGKAITIVIYGERSNGSTYLEAGGTGNKATITPSLFTSINYFEFRFLRSNSKYTDTTTIVTGLRISYGSTATTYTPYENICPISGWTNIKINASKKNLFNKDTVTNDAVMAWANAKIGTETGSWVSDYIPFIKNTNYKLNYNASQIFIFDDEKNAILIHRVHKGESTWTALDGTGGDGKQTFTTPNKGTYLRFCYRKSGSTSAVSPDLIQLELGTTSTTYEPYQGNIYNIQFPSEAGTVYGGTLDVTTGRLIVDKASTVVISNNLSNNGSLDNTYKVFYWVTGRAFTKNVLCNYFNQDTAMLNYMSVRTNSTGIEFTIQNDLIGVDASADNNSVKLPAAKAWFTNNPVQLVYELAEPIIYQLTPQEITMLTGQNYIFSNTGQTAISYYDNQTSTNPYIDYSATSAFEVAQSVSDAIGALEPPYKEVEWVESNGKQYVYLDWKPPIKTWGFEIDFISRNAVGTTMGAWNESTNANGYGTIFGVRNASGVNNAQFSSYSNGLLRLGNGNNVVTGFKTDHSRQTIKLHGTTLTKTDGTTTTVTRLDENTSKPYCNMTVFCLYEGLRRTSTGGLNGPSSTRIYSLKFYDGDTLAVDLVGAIRKADNITGLYDKVSKHFYPAPGMLFGNDVGDISTTDTIADNLNKNDVKCTVVNKNRSRMWETAVPFNRLEDGQKITVTYSYGNVVNSVQTSELVGWDDTSSNSNVYLRVVYPDGVKSEWIPCYYSQTSRLTTHYGAGLPIIFTYHENILSNATETAAGSSIVRGFFANANYDTNTSYTQYSPVKAGVNGIKGYTLAMRDSENTWSCFYSGAYKGTGTGKIAYTGGFILGKVIYSTGAGAQTSNSSLDTYYNYKEGVVTSTNYDAYPVDFRYSTNCATTLIAQRPVYLVGTVESDGLFHLDASQWWTQTEPTFKDNKVYVYLGVAYSTYQIWLSTDNPAYMFYNDKFILYDRALTLQDIDSLKETLESQIDGKVETWCQKSNPASSWSAEERPNHTGDLWYYIGESTSTYKNNTTYQYNGNTNTWTAYSANPDLFDKIDGKTTIYYGTQSSVTSAEEGDYLVDSTDGSSYRWNQGAWVKVTDYKTAINNIQIGGKNLLRGTRTQDTILGNYKNAVTATEEKLFGCTVFTSSARWADIGFDFKKQILDRNLVKAGDSVTYSIWAKTDDTESRNIMGVWVGSYYSGTTIAVLSSEWTQYSKTFVVTEEMLEATSTIATRFECNTDCTESKYIYWAAPKLERGTKPTDWSPAPEDVDSNIQQVQDNLDNLEIGGRNLLRRDPKYYSATSYGAYDLALTEPLEADQKYIIQLWDVDVSHTGKTADQLNVAVYYCGGTILFGKWQGTKYFTDGHADYLTFSFTPTSAIINHANVTSAVIKFIRLYNSVSSANGTMNMHVGKWKIEKGDKATDWSIAPEDMVRGTGFYSITTAPTSYTIATGGFTPAYRIALSTVKTESGLGEVMVGDVIQQGYNTYPVGYVDTSYVYLGSANSIRGATGATGLNNAQVILYRRFASAPSGTDIAPTGDVTYTFATGKAANNLNSWTQNIPTGSNPVYMIAASASNTSATDVIPKTEWSAPVKILENGQNGGTGSAGADGYNQATIFLYQRKSGTAPSKPSSAVTYTFSSGALSSTPTGWSRTIPTNDGNPCYVTTATAVAKTATYSIPANGWSDVVILSQDGEDGTSITITSTSVKYQKGTSGTTAPTGTWGTSIPSVGENEFLWTQTIVNYSDSSKTESYSVSRNAKNGTNGTSPTVSSTTVEYQQSTGGTTPPTGTWATSAPTATAGQYMWTRTTVKYSDNKTAVSYSVSKNGTNGTSPTAYHLIVSHGAINKSQAGVYNPTTITLTSKSQTGNGALNNYNGRFKIETTTDNSTWTQDSASSTANESSKTYTIPANIKAVRFSLYLAGGFTTLLDQQTVPIVIDGAKGDSGDDAYTIVLTNEAHTFPAGVSAALAGSATSSVMTYKGGIQVACFVGSTSSATSISTGTTGLTCAINNNNSKNVSLTFTATTSLTTRAGTVTIPITVDNKAFSKTFTWSLANQGAKGDNGVSVTNVTSTNNTADGGTSVVTITLSDGTTKTFNVKNGTKGNTGATAQWYYGTSLTHTSGTATLVATSTSGAVVGSMYLNTQTSLVYKCTAVGTNNTWTYAGDLTTGVIDNIEIGGRNILLNTNGNDPAKVRTLAAQNAGSTASISNMSTKTMSNGEIHFVTASTTGERYYRYILPQQNNLWGLEAGETYTISFYVKGTINTNDDIKYRSQYVNASSWATLTDKTFKEKVGTNYQKISFTETIPSDAKAYYGSIQVYGSNVSDFYIKNIKLEKGNKATDWTPAPEDVEADITATNVKVDNIKKPRLGWKVNYSAFATASNGECYFHGYDNNNAAANVDGVVEWNGADLTITKGMWINPNTIAPYGKTILHIYRTGTSPYHADVWWDDTLKKWRGYMYKADQTPNTVTDWTWNETTDCILATYVSPSSEGVIQSAQLFNPPKKFSEIPNAHEIVNNLEIGGRNILLNSATNSPITYGSSTLTIEPNVAIPEFSCTDGIRCSGAGGTNTICALINNASHGLSVSSPISINRQPYVFSIYVKNNHTTNVFGVSSNVPGDTRQTVQPGEAKRLIMYTTGNGSSHIQFNMSTNTAGDNFDVTIWHPQIELGNKVTDWTSALEDTDASIQQVQTNLDNLEVGGRNLLLNTAKMTTWNKGAGEVTLTDEYALLNGTDADWGSRIDSRKLDLSLLDGETNYILSFEYKTSIDTVSAPIMIAGTNYTKEDNMWGRTKYCTWSTPNVVLSNTNGEWKKFVTTSRTIILSDLSAGSGGVNSWYVQMYVRTNNANLYVRKFQLEKGNKATDWTLAPEDTNASIQQVQDNLDNLKIGGRNLLSKDKIIPYTTSFTEENYVYTGNCGAGGGLRIPSSLFTVGTSYVLSFKFKKISGTLKGIGGHSGGFTNNKFIVDGVIDNSRPYNSGHVMSDDTVEHTVEAYFTFNNDHATDNNLYIQPNRNSYTSSNDSQFQFWDIQLEIGDKATDWTPAPEDTDASIQQVQSNLDNLEIGGRNLLKNSKALTTNWTLQQATVANGIVTVTPTASGNRRMYQMPAEGYWTWTVGQEYTVSVDARSDNGASFTFVATGVASDGTAITSPAITATSDWKRYSFTFTAAHSSNGSMTFSIVEASSKTIQFKEPKLEYGNKATSWTPAPEDTQADIDTAIAQSVEYIIGTQTAATGTWTGRASTLSELRDGTQIRYWLPYAGSGNATLNLTLKDGTATGAIPVYRQGGSYDSKNGIVVANRVTTHFPAGTSISMVYGVNRVVSAVYSNVTYTGTFTGWFADGAYDSGNTYNRIRMQNTITAATAITKYHIICGTASGYKNIGANVTFDLSYPLLYANADITAAATGTDNYLQINSIGASNNGTITSGGANKELYLKGTVSGNTFTISASPFMTTVIPNSADGFYYIPLGLMYSATAIYFTSSNRLYAYLDGAFQPVDTAAILRAEEAKKSATNYMSSDNTGIMVADLKDTNYEEYLPGIIPNGKNVYITAGYKNESETITVDPGVYIRDGQINLAMFGENVRIGKDSSTHGYLYEDYHSLQLVDKERYTYFYVSDLRNAEGYVSLIDTFDGDGIKTSFDLSFTANSTDYTVEVSDNSGGTITKAENWFSFSEAPTANSTITVSYNSESYSLKAYTLGKRKSNERVGGMSVAEGLSTIAKGHYSHAEGLQTEANRYCSHTEGFQTIANGHSAHAENYMTHADGWASHAEGGYTFAKGEYCHAEGGGTEAYGANSHAEGRNTLAKGNYSHAQNRQTIAYGSCQTVIGRYNQEDSEANPNDTTQYGKYALIIGNGNNLQQRSNALCVDWNGNVELALKTSASSGTDDANLYSVLTTLGWQNDVIV